MSKIILLLSIIIGFNAFAAKPCPTEQSVGENVIANRFPTVGYGCIVQITPKTKTNMTYREYWLDERGRLLVFNSIPGDDMTKSTGTRTFFLFPRTHLPSFQLQDDGTISLYLGSGAEFLFSKDARPLSLPGQFTESDQINLENNGGFEFDWFEGIRLDAGWKTGSEAYKDPNGKSTFIDRKNKKCEITNNEFFFYENTYYGEPNLLYPDDDSLVDFLHIRCPELDLVPLQEGA